MGSVSSAFAFTLLAHLGFVAVADWGSGWGLCGRERLVPHSAVQDLVAGRYPLAPADLYALSRVDSRNRIDLDHDIVDADFVVFGVLAWKDEVRFLNGAIGRDARGGASGAEKKARAGDEESEDEDDGPDVDKAKKETASISRDALFRPPTRRSRRLRYVRFDMIDLSTPRACASATGQLSLMLVQADSVDKAVDDDGNELEVYKGQSGGAYERYWKESPGAVVAIVNPIFLPHNKVRFSPSPPPVRPKARVLMKAETVDQAYSYTIKPTSADSVHVIGRAENLTFCEAIKKDGRQCGKWVDACVRAFFPSSLRSEIER